MITGVRFGLITAQLSDHGLASSLALRNLGRVVMVAGPNGCGKSRFLRFLLSLVARATQLNMFGTVEFGALRRSWEGQRAAATGEQARHIDAMLGNIDAFDALSMTTPSPPTAILLSVPRSATVRDASNLTDSEREIAALATTAGGLGTAYENEHAYLRAVAGGLMLSDLKNPPTDVQAATLSDARSFSRLVNLLLGTDLTWDMSKGGVSVPILFGRPFSTTELSEGQKILLAWAIVLHKQRENLKNAVLLIDEPENHLHPDACVNALKRLDADILGEHGQIWIATHSIPLVAWAGADALYAMNNGAIEYAGNRICEVVETLAGGKGGRESLQGILADADRIGFLHFVAQCLAEPGVVGAVATDPQEGSFAALVGRLAKSTPLRVLDFGAGRGRLAHALTRAFAGEPETLQRISYMAWDPSSEFVDERSTNVGRLAASGASARIVTDIRECQLEDERVDLVVMCNVLHEIPPEDWLTAFADCHRALKEGGSLVILEDQQPAVGELPHAKGFILLDLVEAKALFGGSANVHPLADGIPEPYRGRLSVHEIRREHLLLATSETRRSALEFVKARAMREVEWLRSQAGQSSTQKQGRLQALYAMLWMNASLALKTS